MLSLRRTLSVVFLLAGGALGAGLASGAEDDLSFSFVNRDSARTVKRLHVSPTTDNEWGPDRLGDAVLPPGGRLMMHLPHGTCSYDLQVVYQDDSVTERRSLNLCTNPELVIP